MTELNWWLTLVAFLAGVIFTLLWSLRRVTVQTSADAGSPEVAEPAVEADQAPADAETKTEAAGDSDSDPVLASVIAAGRNGDSATQDGDADDVSWWDRAFVAHRPAPAISAAELAAATREFSSRPDFLSASRDLVGPDGQRIKGNRESMLYHTIASPYYGRTKAEEWFASEAEAEAAGFTRWDRRKLATSRNAAASSDAATDAGTADVTPRPRNGKHRTNGSAAPASIKGNRGSMLYHTIDSPYYGRTKAEEWFTTEAEATAAGYRRWDHKRAGRR